MSERLLDLATRKLLAKFGAGMHKPGSGSASAFQGMLAAQLLITVIDMSNHPVRRDKYGETLPELLKIQSDIQGNLYPTLEKLFQEDSDHFDKVIGLRRERDAIDPQKDGVRYREKVAATNAALRLATDLPIRIAEICCRLAKHAEEVFDHGFKSARGDSGVALQCAISGVASCLSIIDLNLTKLPADSWMDGVRIQKAKLKSDYNELSALGKVKLGILEKQAEENWQYHQTFASYRKGTLGPTIQNDRDMEKVVKDFQNKLWLKRERIWGKGIITDPMKVINPKDVLQKVLGYTFLQSDFLGMHAVGDDIFEVAGLIDKNQMQVSISKRFSSEIMNFTAAHELGHLILHEQTVLHRDRPIDGTLNIPKDSLEQQADKFAAYFLMPARAVKDVFYEMFDTEKLPINEATVLAMAAGNLGEFKKKHKDQHGFATVIAQTKLYGGKSFNSLAEIFNVSAGAMAIRLIELSLVEF